MELKRLVLSIIFISLSIGGLKAQEDINQAKAIYIYNFLSHIMWQENPNKEKMVIGVVGDSKIYEHLIAYTQNRKVGSKSIKIIRVKPDQQLLNCHVVYVSNEVRSDIQKISKIVKNRSCLIVGDDIAMNKYGAIISFAHEGYKLKYKLSEENAVAHNLVISKALKAMSL